MASLTQYSVVAACLNSKKRFINISALSAPTTVLDAKTHRPSTIFFQLNTGKAASFTISNAKGKKRKDDQWRVFGSEDGSCGIAPMPALPSVVELAQDFYNAINSKDIKNLDPLLADDCQYKDLVFYVPFEGKEQGVLPFLGKMMDAMGPNIHFVIDNVTEGMDLTASVFWHLEWKDKVIPFAKGCTFFEYQEVAGCLLLRKATGMAELPFKPGDFVLKVLKTISSFFDLYPMAAEALLLRSSEVGGHEEIDTFLNKFWGKH